jgi:cell division initiation protein
MDLTPNDIRSHEFSSQMRGYDKEEVDGFLEQAANALDTLKQENLRLSMELDSVKTQLTGMREFEDTIKDAAIDARRNADMTVANARKEAELILQRASAEADKIIGARSRQVSELEDQISKLEVMKKSYLSKLRSMMNSHMDALDEIARLGIKRELSTDTHEEVTHEERIEVTESSEVRRNTFETVATRPSPNPAIRTEEANAAEQIVPADPRAVTTPPPVARTIPPVPPQAPPASAALDPELAAALESYTRQVHSRNEDFGMGSSTSRQTVTAVAPAPAPGEFVETNLRAEDVPLGFISNEPLREPVDERATDKVHVPPPYHATPAEPHSLDVLAAAEPGEPKKVVNPEDLAD